MALNIENIIAEVKEASIRELSGLVKAIEEFGVTAAAHVAVAAASAADAGAAKIHSISIDICRRQRKSAYVIKIVREITGLES